MDQKKTLFKPFWFLNKLNIEPKRFESLGSYNAFEGKEDSKMENQKLTRANFPGNCNGYKMRADSQDSSGNLCGTCLFEEFCVYLEIVQLSDAMKGCLPLSKKSTPAGRLARELLGRAECLFDELRGLVRVSNVDAG